MYKSRLIDNGDGTVTHELTALQWQKEDDGIERGYEEARRYAEQLRLAGYDDWRLPRKEELIELAKLGYDVIKQVLPNTRADGYWAETAREESYWADGPDDMAYAVEFDPASANYGADVAYPRSYGFYVRAVRSVS